MVLVDDLAMRPTDAELERRKFLGLLGSGALALAGLGAAITTVRYMAPNVLFEEDTRFGVGRPEEYSDGMVGVFPERRLFVVRSAEGFFAMSAVCTHLGCIARWEPENSQFFCPCHGSRYFPDGKVKQGPAPKTLQRLQLTLERGILIVDTAKIVPEGTIFKVA